MKQLGLSPLRNFGIVDRDKNIYRSAQPVYAYEYRWIKERLGVDTIINLRAESRHDDKMCVAHEFGLKVINIDVRDHKPPTIGQAHEFMNLIRDGKNILFHCEHGHGRTSTFCVLARIAAGLDVEAAIEKEDTDFCYQFKHPEQKEFLIKNFKPCVLEN